MDRLCDEVIQLIFYELSDPGPLTKSSRRFHAFSQDPYIRAHYFLTRYGEEHAIYYALGRGRVINEAVLDMLLTTGAHLSRYLVQIAIHHYFHTQAHFIKTPWVRTMSLKVFVYFMHLAEKKYGEIPHGKGEDDGSMFMAFLKESRMPPASKFISWEIIKDILEKYNDPIMSQFPLILAIEPRLLPYATANGFKMDTKYRDFVFRKMFEKPLASSEIRADDIARNVRELCELDATMFVTRTVAAEICMEAKLNEPGYSALKQLDKSGHLHFELSSLVEDLLKTFLKTRSICNVATGDVLRHLYADFPSPDPAARLVVLIAVFIAAENLQQDPSIVHARLETLGVLPLTDKDLYNVLINPFVERYNVLLSYAREEVGVKEDGTKGMDAKQIRDLVEVVCMKCLEVACKGKLLKKLYDGFPSVNNAVMKRVLEKYTIKLEDVPEWDDNCLSPHYEASLCRDFVIHGVGDIHTQESLLADVDDKEQKLTVDEEEKEYSAKQGVSMPIEEQQEAGLDLGSITQESLSAMIRQDEVTPVRSRRRIYYHAYGDTGKLHYPHDPLHVGRWIKLNFGIKSSVTAVFLTHAIINENSGMLHYYFMRGDGGFSELTSSHVPVTLKHFQILARLGRAPVRFNSSYFYIFQEIECGAEFYLDEDDYISKQDIAKNLLNDAVVKKEASSSSLPPSPASRESPSSSSRGRKRPRRSVAKVRSYALDTDSEDFVMDDYGDFSTFGHSEKKVVKDSNLQQWIKHLTELCKDEERKYKEIKKRAEKAAEPGSKVRVMKTEFLKALGSNLRTLRKLEAEKRLKYFGTEDPAEYYSDDDEYTTKRIIRRRRPDPY
ncbi:hypothetical protein BDQ12DRAFT_770762 [Crucibulum laeve]|uniref:Uncharacterized protein n=1 Tax=Crucibulum laeve TaxID=68775 RepID=A0A5C3M614_9AGAR|nr:hypothetical protein BDQ12DRAFT_770762 [Crucibulum laeve]